MDGDKRSRRRVAFADSTAESEPAHSAKRSAPKVTRVPDDEVRDSDFLDADDDGETEVVEARLGAGFDEDGEAPSDDDDGNDNEGRDDGDGRARVVKKLTRVKGEMGEAEEEVNDAGQAYEPFNLRDAQEDGYYDAGGNYVWKKKTADDYDPWLQELDGMAAPERRALQQKAARAAATAATAAGTATVAAGAGGAAASTVTNPDASDGSSDDGSADEGAAEVLAPTSRVALLRTIYEHMEDEETVAGALRRFGAKTGGLNGRRGAAVDAPAFDSVTEAADALLGDGLVDVYSMRRTAIRMELNDALDSAGLPPIRPDAASTDVSTAAAAQLGPVSAAPHTGAPPVVRHPDKRWRYKWIDSADAPVFGPFSSAEMAAWYAAGFFTAGGPSAGALLVQEDAASAPSLQVATGSDDDIFGAPDGSVPVAAVVANPPAASRWIAISDVQF